MKTSLDHYLAELKIDKQLLGDSEGFFGALRARSPVSTSIIAVDAMENYSMYMDVFIALARLAGVGDNVKRVIAEPIPVSGSEISFTFCFNGQPVKWRFSSLPKNLSAEFLSRACSFLEHHGRLCVVQMSEPANPLLKLVSLPLDVVDHLTLLGWPIKVLIRCEE